MLLVAALTACGEGADEADTPEGLRATVEALRSQAGAVGDPAGAEATPGPFDSCALLTDDEVTAVIGPHGPGRLDGILAGTCSWANEENYATVTLTVGHLGSAPDGRLPEASVHGATEAGPDGIRFATGDIAEFAVRDRACEIYVLTASGDDDVRPAIVTLAGLVRQRLESAS